MVYDGTSWTFVSPANNYVDLLKGITHTYMLRYGAIGGVTYHCPMNIDGSGYFNDPNVSSSDFGLGPWENLINPVAYSFYGKVSHLYVRSWPPSGPVYAMDLPVTGTPLYIKSRIRGAWTGPSIWVVNPNDGQLWFSADGSSFTNAGVNAQWDVNSNDVVMNTSLTGGGTYVWMKNTTAFGTILRYLDPAFAAPAVDRTGNYWTHIQTGGGGFSVVDMYVGYH